MPGDLRVGIVGRGAIGRAVHDELAAGRVPGAVPSGLLGRSPDAATADARFADLLAASDVVLEAAGHPALAAHGPTTVESGRDLLVLSVGALADDDLRARVLAGPGRAHLVTGAVGGVDVLAALHRGGGVDRVCLRTTKPGPVLVQPWMPEGLRRELTAGRPTVAFAGTAREAARRFPASANVAATVALAALGLDRTDVEVHGGPAGQPVRHVIEAAGPLGTCRVELGNRPSAANPRTSAVVPWSAVVAIERLAAEWSAMSARSRSLVRPTT